MSSSQLKPVISVLGTGTIGTGWAVQFAKEGCSVTLYDVAHGAAERSHALASDILRRLEALGLCDDAEAATARICVASTLHEAVANASYVQESVVEDPAIKAGLISSVSKFNATAIIASSTSAIDPALIFTDVASPELCLVAHPFNPPYLMPLVELVSAPGTSPDTMERVRTFLVSCGMSPVTLHRAIPGFVANRLQAAVVNEAVHLVAQGIIDPEGLDLCMTEALGLRWAFIGPFATMDLNAPEGVAEYMAKFGRAYEALGRDLGVAEPWPEATQVQIKEARRALLPANQIGVAAARRDQAIAALLNLRRRISAEGRANDD